MGRPRKKPLPEEMATTSPLSPPTETNFSEEALRNFIATVPQECIAEGFWEIRIEKSTKDGLKSTSTVGYIEQKVNQSYDEIISTIKNDYVPKHGYGKYIIRLCDSNKRPVPNAKFFIFQIEDKNNVGDNNMNGEIKDPQKRKEIEEMNVEIIKKEKEIELKKKEKELEKLEKEDILKRKFKDIDDEFETRFSRYPHHPPPSFSTTPTTSSSYSPPYENKEKTIIEKLTTLIEKISEKKEEKKESETEKKLGELIEYLKQEQQKSLERKLTEMTSVIQKAVETPKNNEVLQAIQEMNKNFSNLLQQLVEQKSNSKKDSILELMLLDIQERDKQRQHELELRRIEAQKEEERRKEEKERELRREEARQREMREYYDKMSEQNKLLLSILTKDQTGLTSKMVEMGSTVVQTLASIGASQYNQSVKASSDILSLVGAIKKAIGGIIGKSEEDKEEEKETSLSNKLLEKLSEVGSHYIKGQIDIQQTEKQIELEKIKQQKYIPVNQTIKKSTVQKTEKTEVGGKEMLESVMNASPEFFKAMIYAMKNDEKPTYFVDGLVTMGSGVLEPIIINLPWETEIMPIFTKFCEKHCPDLKEVVIDTKASVWWKKFREEIKLAFETSAEETEKIK